MVKETYKQKIAVVGLGNELMTDDGLGVHAIRLLQKETLAKDVQVVEIGTAALHYQDLFEQSDIIIAIDAIAAGGPAGQIVCFDGAEAEIESTHSLHDLGAVGLLQLIAPDRRPKLILLGAEPLVVDYGTELSPALQNVLPRLVQAAKDITEKVRNVTYYSQIEDLFSIRT